MSRTSTRLLENRLLELRLLEIAAAIAAVAFASLAFAPAASAQEPEEFKYGVELGLGASYASNGEGSDFDLSTWAVRYHVDWNERWGLEGSYTYQDRDFFEADLYEISARFTFFSNDRVRLFALAGAGYLAFDYAVDFGDGDIFRGSDDGPIYHLGIAAQVALGDRFYLRPDLRYRRAIDLFSPYDDTSAEASIAFGYRF